MATTDKKVEECVAYYKRLLVAQTPKTLSRVPASRLQVIIGRAGGKRRSPELLARLDQAFAAAGIETHPPLTDPSLENDDRVLILDARHPLPGLTPTRQLFSKERTLQSFIWANRHALDQFQDLGLKSFRPQAKLDSGRKIDLLCQRSALNQLVGIELKVLKPDDRAAGQLLQYLDDLAEHAGNRGYDSAHLIVIGGQPDKSVRNRVERYAATRGLTVTFLLYKVHIELLAHP